jgi:hypothetical protein
MLHTTDQVIEREDVRGIVRKACLVEAAQLLVAALKERPANKTWCRNSLSTCRIARQRRSLIAPREPTTPLGTKGMGGGYPREGMISRWIYCNENNDRERFGAVHRDAGDSFGSRS